MNRFFSIAFIAVLLLSFIHPPNVSPAEGDPGEVTAVTLRNWPPHFITDDKTGKPAGFAIDIMNRVAELSDIKVRYVVCDTWPDAFEALRNHRAVLAPNMGITDERLGLYDFTTPYETFRISIFVRNATVGINEISDLDGKKVGVVKQNQGLVLMRERGVSNLQIFNSMEEAFMALLSGSVDALVYPEQPITGIAMRSGLEGKIKIVAKPLQEIKRAIAVIKGEPILFSKLDKAISQFIKTSEYQMIYEKWYGKPEPFWNVTRVIIVMGVVLVLTIASMLAWRYASIVRLNRSLSEAEERFRGIVENTDAGYFFIDNEGKFQRVNNAWLKMHGYDSRDEVIGQPFTLTQVSADMEAAQQNVEMLLGGRTIPSGEFTRRCKDGSVGYHTFSANPVVQSGQLVGVEGFIIDTNELKLADKEKRELEIRLWKARKAESLGRMAGAVAHHFNNQLSVVMGNLELALEDISRDAVNRENLVEALQAAQRSTEIGGLMLTYLGQGTGRREPLNLSDVCRKNLPMLNDAIPKNISLETDFISSGPVALVNAYQIQVILKHLVTNSSESIGENKGTITVATRTLPVSGIPFSLTAPADWKPTADTFASLEVSDSGCGMTDEDMDRLFDPFFSTKFTGRGLGLSVVLGIVKSWDGAISVESTKDLGSTFRVLLPLCTDEPRRQKEGPQMKEGGTVLLVDEQGVLRKMAKQMLNRLGFSVLSAENGTVALRLFHEHRAIIRCLIADLTTPGMDGWETLTALRKINPDLPVILVSGHGEAHVVGGDDSEQPDVVLHKPYSKDELKNALRQALGDEAQKDD